MLHTVEDDAAHTINAKALLLVPPISVYHMEVGGVAHIRDVLNPYKVGPINAKPMVAVIGAPMMDA